MPDCRRAHGQALLWPLGWRVSDPPAASGPEAGASETSGPALADPRRRRRRLEPKEGYPAVLSAGCDGV
jgi:hypothetical protein